MTEEITNDNAAGILLGLADHLEANPKDVGAIAAGFRVLAAVMILNEDCAAVKHAVIDPADNPEAGAEPRKKLTAEESNAIGAAMGSGFDLVDTAGVWTEAA